MDGFRAVSLPRVFPVNSKESLPVSGKDFFIERR
jgi:hypothetical protein